MRFSEASIDVLDSGPQAPLRLRDDTVHGVDLVVQGIYYLAIKACQRVTRGGLRQLQAGNAMFGCGHG
jgi:hypothetical protein